jgi:hypothetical protein
VEAAVDEQVLNMSVRTFLKEVGVTSQREIEKAVRDAVARGSVTKDAALAARVEVSIPEVGLTHLVRGEIRLG